MAEENFIQDFIQIFDEYNGEVFTGWFIMQFSNFNERSGDILCLLLSSKGDAAFVQKFKNAVIPYMNQYLYIPPTDEEMYYIFDFVIIAIASFFVLWYEKEKSHTADHAIENKNTSPTAIQLQGLNYVQASVT